MRGAAGDLRSDDGATAELVDAALGASRVLVAVAARSLAGVAEDVTLAQFRALVVLSGRGPQRVAELAAELDVNASTATRMCDRLVRKELITRRRLTSDRRTVLVELSGAGAALVAAVTERRRVDITRIVDQLPVAGRAQLVEVLRLLSEVGGEAPQQHWSLGWEHDTDG